MKYINLLFFFALALTIWSCQEEEFAEAYPDPAKIAETTLERQYTGMVQAGTDYVVPNYRNYFVTLRTTLNPWTQSIGWINTPNQYIPGSSGVEDVWFNYYQIMAQYREFQKVWNQASAEKQAANSIFRMTADVYLYNETLRMVDLFSTIPFFNAGMLSINGGDYSNSYAEFDTAEEIYTYILDELKSIADEFNSIDVNAGVQSSFSAQDIINNGDVELWQRYTNSLRLRMLTRVSGNSTFSSRAQSEISEIIGNPSQYPLVENNDQNIMIDVYDVNTPINSQGFQEGINSDGWDGNDAPQKMINFLKDSGDPRLRVLFEPAESTGEYVGLDPLMGGSDQQALVNNGEIAMYNRSTTSNNDFFPGVLINAAEVSFLKAENHLKNGDDGAAKTAYEKGIEESIGFYYYVRSISNDDIAGATDTATTQEVEALLASDLVSWDQATSQEEKLDLIAHQKWIHFNIIQPYQNWAEVRRLNTPELDFWVDNSSIQTTPPQRWNIPGNEITFNTENYNAIRSNDELDNKLFWDVD